MFNRGAFGILLDKVPTLASPWGILLTMLYTAFLALLCILFFSMIDALSWYTPLISQLIMALITVVISYAHFKVLDRYRKRYESMAYQYFFYHWMLPYLVAWYACFFHPLFIDGPALLPSWLAIVLGVFFLLLVPITSVHIERAGFHMETHGLDLYTVFPGESPIVRGEIYAYIRHPLYFALSCGTLGLAFFANNWIALVAAVLQLIPALFAGRMEDRELLERDSSAHAEYIQNTGALLPRRDVLGFLHLLFVGLLSPGAKIR